MNTFIELNVLYSNVDSEKQFNVLFFAVFKYYSVYVA